MFNIADYFKKFSKIEGESLHQRDSIKAALYETCKLDKVDFEVKKGILYIKGSPMVKSIVYTKKGTILALIKTRIPDSRISDIR